ncbi:MAG: cell division protein ZapA [Candidatus Puniceispirillaceae bacterium]
MSQSVVTVRLNGQPYQMGCGPGEEAHIEALAQEVDDIITAVKADAGQLGDTRLLAMVALILADQKHTLQNSSGQNGSGQNDSGKDAAADKDAGAGIDDAAEALLASQLDAMAVKLRSLKAQIESTS